VTGDLPKRRDGVKAWATATNDSTARSLEIIHVVAIIIVLGISLYRNTVSQLGKRELVVGRGRRRAMTRERKIERREFGLRRVM
jgi:hypothetical protein